MKIFPTLVNMDSKYIASETNPVSGKRNDQLLNFPNFSFITIICNFWNYSFE